jgi:hypothetical protein
VKTIAVRIGVVLFAVTAAIATFGTGTSAAKDPYVGLTYAQASAKISDKNRTPAISTVVGAQLPTDQCIVTSWREPSYDKTDNFDHKKEILLSLNCSAKLAHAGLPGNSLASPEGRTEQAHEVRAERYNSKPTRCEKNLDSCQKFCEKYAGLCSDEVMALF